MHWRGASFVAVEFSGVAEIETAVAAEACQVLAEE